MRARAGRRRRPTRLLALLGVAAVLGVGGLAPAATAAPAAAAVTTVAGGLPGPEVIDRSTIAPVLIGTGCAAGTVALPLVGPVTWWVVAGGSVTPVDASQPYAIDPAAATRLRATLSRGARFDDGSTTADWTIGPAAGDLVTGCTPPTSPPPPTSAPPTSTPPTTAPSASTTAAPVPPRAPAPGSTAPGSPTTPAAPAGPAAEQPASSGPTDDAGVATNTGRSSGTDPVGGTTGAADVATSEAPVVLAAPEVETRVLSNSFTRPEVSATAAAVPSASGDGGGTVAPLAGVIALLAASGLVAGLLLYRGARGAGRPATNDGTTPLA